jgi:formate hydrogenlyase subunit 3/multisubunit Na+/H+ antiporter MnhD subunit
MLPADSSAPRWTAGERAFVAGIVGVSAAAAALAIRVLATGESVSVRIPASVPGGDWLFGVDPLSAFFLLAVAVVGAASATYGISYLAPARGHRPRWFIHAAVASLVLALALVVTAKSVVPFLCAWELMAIGSYVLIVTDREQEQVRRAGLLYLVVTHAGTLALFLMFALWSNGTPDWSFASLAASTPRASVATTSILLLALVGFGVKAGIVPAHFWLPGAHAAAPSHVSALMSGVVIKTGIYGLLRVTMMVGATPAWWGWTILILGTASALLGVLWALAQHDLKRLLAYHSVENIGIILIGMGLGSLAGSYGHPQLAAIGYAAAVLHTLNHALFKSVLFLGAGAVHVATGSRHIEDLGGLGRRMPLLAVTFALGSAAIVGLPPLNGFVSEWLVFQGLMAAATTEGVLRFAVLAVPCLALVGGLALACFTKVFGVIFLGTPRTDRAEHAVEAPRGMVVPPAVLAALCAALGLAPFAVFPALLGVGARVAGADASASGSDLGRVLADATRVSWFAATLVLAIAAVWGWRSLMLRGRIVRRAPTWTCGYAAPTSRMQYSASSFAAPLLGLFGGLSGLRVHRGDTRFHTTSTDPLVTAAIAPAWASIRRSALRLRRIQHGRLHFYLLYVVVTLVAALAYLSLWPHDR